MNVSSPPMQHPGGVYAATSPAGQRTSVGGAFLQEELLASAEVGAHPRMKIYTRPVSFLESLMIEAVTMKTNRFAAGAGAGQ